MTKEYVKTIVATLDVYQTLPQLLKSIEALIAQYGDTAEAKLEQDPYSSSYSVRIFKNVLETDEQYAWRIESIADLKLYEEKRDRETLARLKKLYPNAR